MPWYVLTRDEYLIDDEWDEVEEFDDEDEAMEYVWYLQTKERIAGEPGQALFKLVYHA